MGQQSAQIGAHDHFIELWVALAKRFRFVPSVLAGPNRCEQGPTLHVGRSVRRRFAQASVLQLDLRKTVSREYPINTFADVAQLNDVYPYIRYFDYNTPDSIKKEYITSINDTWVASPVRATKYVSAQATSAPTPYPAGPMP